ncbi:hypothetical protein HN695_01215 [Candidatus Woesearchaeota archaeon]|jgi:hypothetical protein|nr:hypothetical protein [Candidatus Woesearchaeota archaeon]MBT5273020.1 hypothetical protein [Candidatus Woesearchaeota archaeon]MBT6040844.1 hypothetical protein [Candidatus Woesearchaeota archaeon]MBT6336723.1 hypothetical protein [Candidatus Woesearchaeota archaeon]MBT7926934.1 hypothetical protein [Candidatus Woesearchaeota archaeon]
MSKKSQIQQAFFYILAIFIIGTILLLGVKYVGKIMDQLHTVDLVTFKTSLEDDSEVMAVKYGSWEKKDYIVPKDIKKMCFFTIDPIYSNKCDQYEELDPLMCDLWQSGQENVIAVPFMELESGINLTNMEVKNIAGYHCFAVAEKRISIKITGKGNGVIVSEP